MELSSTTAESYVRHALVQMLEVADRVGEPRINQRPLGPQTNSIAALIVHSCGAAEFWLGHVALGLRSDRDRDSEFSQTSTVADLHHLVDESISRIHDHLGRLDAGEGIEGGRQRLLDTSDASLVMHVLGELFQHLGHIELAADALTV